MFEQEEISGVTWRNNPRSRRNNERFQLLLTMMGRQVFGAARSLVCYKEVHKKNTCRYPVSWWSLAGPTCHEVRSSRHTHPQSLCQEVGHIQPGIGADGILCEIQERQQVIAKDLNVWEIRSGHKIGSKASHFAHDVVTQQNTSLENFPFQAKTPLMIHCWKAHIILLLKRVVVARPSSPITCVDSVAPDVLEVQRLDHFEGGWLPPWDLTLGKRPTTLKVWTTSNQWFKQSKYPPGPPATDFLGDILSCRIGDSEMFKITKLSETSLTSTKWQRGPQVKQLVRLSLYYFGGPRLWCFWCLHAPCVFSVGTHHCGNWGCCGKS